MERVLKAVPVDLRVKMEALVHDLTLALEESSTTTNVRRRWGLRRRARSAGNIPSYCANKHSDDSSSSICDVRCNKLAAPHHYAHSDSDDGNGTKRLARFSDLNNPSNIESDSVNENFVPSRNTKRKRKLKRMAVDSDSNPSTSQAIGQKKRLLRSNCENRFSTIWCGKRKRSCRERSTDCEMRSPKPSRTSKSRSRVKLRSEDAMDCSRLSSSSLSSSDSESGIRTNEADHEGDDEQSDWFGESSWWEDDNTNNDDKVFTADSSYSTIFNYRQRNQANREGLIGREIRAGRRHVDNKPGYSIITSANEKVSRFLQDPSQSELRLHAMRQPEREKLRRLANLYSLSLKGDLSCPILCKTRHTTQAICVDQVSLNRFSDYKRLRRTPPQSPNPEIATANNFIPIFHNNFTIPSNSTVTQTATTFDWGSNSMDAELADNATSTTAKFDINFGHSKSS